MSEESFDLDIQTIDYNKEKKYVSDEQDKLVAVEEDVQAHKGEKQ